MPAPRPAGRRRDRLGSVVVEPGRVAYVMAPQPGFTTPRAAWPPSVLGDGDDDAVVGPAVTLDVARVGVPGHGDHGSAGADCTGGEDRGGRRQCSLELLVHPGHGALVVVVLAAERLVVGAGGALEGVSGLRWALDGPTHWRSFR